MTGFEKEKTKERLQRLSDLPQSYRDRNESKRQRTESTREKNSALYFLLSVVKKTMNYSYLAALSMQLALLYPALTAHALAESLALERSALLRL